MASPRKAAPARGWLRKLFIASVVGACLFTLLLAVHVPRLDWIVRDRFADVQWALPAQIYAAPTELYAGRRIDRSQLVDRLQQLGYRQRSNAASTGSFAFDGRDLLVASRGFQFWDAAEPARRLRLRFGDGGIRSINLADEGSTVAIARLDPLLIGSIFPKQGEDRVLVRLEDVPPLLIETLLDIEDRKFRSHWGVDPVAIARAAWANLRARQVVQGGSTIT
ncbi:penicillin-binding protein 1B, partial [bacterium]|nr:penicillin-binding protein 1B [bacterium]